MSLAAGLLQAPPAGFVLKRACPAPSTATHSVLDAQETPLNA